MSILWEVLTVIISLRFVEKYIGSVPINQSRRFSEWKTHMLSVKRDYDDISRRSKTVVAICEDMEAMCDIILSYRHFSSLDGDIMVSHSKLFKHTRPKDLVLPLRRPKGHSDDQNMNPALNEALLPHQVNLHKSFSSDIELDSCSMANVAGYITSCQANSQPPPNSAPATDTNGYINYDIMPYFQPQPCLATSETPEDNFSHNNAPEGNDVTTLEAQDSDFYNMDMQTPDATPPFITTRKGGRNGNRDIHQFYIPKATTQDPISRASTGVLMNRNFNSLEPGHPIFNHQGLNCSKSAREPFGQVFRDQE